MDVFIARRPVFDRFSKVYGYKLVHSAHCTPVLEDENSEDSALQLIDNSMLVFDLETISSGKKVFFSFTNEALENECAELLPKESAVIDLLPSVRPVPSTVASCQRLKDSGYLLSAPLCAKRGWDTELHEMADIISIDFLSWSESQLRADAFTNLGWGQSLMARSVSTLGEYRVALDLGCKFIEGSFFSQPVIISGSDIPGLKPNYLQLLRALNDADIDFKEIGGIIGREVSMAYKLLRLVNSPAFGLRGKIDSIDRALMILGARGLRQWASVIAVAELSSAAPAELITSSSVRARFCQLVGERLGWNHLVSNLFVTGLFSRLDALVGRPLDELLEDVGIDATVKAALRGEDNELRRVFDVVVAYEQGNWDRVGDLATRAGIPAGDLPGLYVPAVEWANASTAATA